MKLSEHVKDKDCKHKKKNVDEKKTKSPAKVSILQTSENIVHETGNEKDENDTTKDCNENKVDPLKKKKLRKQPYRRASFSGSYCESQFLYILYCYYYYSLNAFFFFFFEII